MHPHLRPRKAGGELTGSAGVVDVDVSNDQSGEVIDAKLVEGGQQVPQRGRRAHLDQHAFRCVEQVTGEPVGCFLHPGVDEVEAVAERLDASFCHGGTLPF